MRDECPICNLLIHEPDSVSLYRPVDMWSSPSMQPRFKLAHEDCCIKEAKAFKFPSASNSSMNKGYAPYLTTPRD